MGVRNWSCAVVVVVGAVSLGGCSSAEEEQQDPSEWPASEQVRSLLNVNTWKLTPAGDHAELSGIGDGSMPTETSRLSVHANLWQKPDGGYTLDFDLPRKWRMDYVAGGLPTTSDDIPIPVAYALASSVLDAPKAAAKKAPSSNLMVAQGLSPLNDNIVSGIIQQKGCLIQTQVVLLQNSGQYSALGGQAASVLKQFPQCVQNGNVVSTANSSSAAVSSCKSAVEAAGCNYAETNGDYVRGMAQDAADVLHTALQTGSQSDVSAATQNSSDLTSAASDSDFGSCSSWTPGCNHTAADQECITRAECNTRDSGQFYVLPSSSCSASKGKC
jgi:hypothetical protein